MLALVTMVFMVGALKKSVENRTKELKAANSKLMELSVTDELTGLYNYRHFITTLNKEWGRSKRNKSSISIAIIDVDFLRNTMIIMVIMLVMNVCVRLQKLLKCNYTDRPVLQLGMVVKNLP
jgi:predicted signal transduction protein with EAL and GGDEF domain